ncbi:MAG: phosphomannomutase/phosphoglucomutase [Actinobacteria bacterium]|nr:phosphomannomutase/phosphoglucomutase [Actinomycetota bacterium]
MADRLDEIFGAYDIRGIAGENIDTPIMRAIGRAYGDHVAPGRGRFLIGHDGRTTSPALSEAVSVGLREGGHSVVHLGLAPTPMCYWVGATSGFAGSVTVTASHLPPEHNGCKLCRDDAIPLSGEDGLPEIKAAVRANAGGPPALGRASEMLGRLDAMAAYVDCLRSHLRLARPLRFAVDASCGAGALDTGVLFEDEAAAALGLEVWKLNFNVDGRFPAHAANPLEAAATEQLSRLVVEHGLDFGLCYDGDADRAVVVDEHGQRLPPDTLGGLLAVHLLGSSPGATALYDLRASRALPEAIEAAGGKAVRTRVGHAIVKPAMRAHDALFAAELSGHYYYRDLHFTDSGIRTLIELINLVSAGSEPLSWLRSPFETYAVSGEVNRAVTDRDEVRTVLDVLAATFADGQIDHLDGLSVDYDDWWFNVRASNTEPVLRFNIGAVDQATLERRQVEVFSAAGV